MNIDCLIEAYIGESKRELHYLRFQLWEFRFFYLLEFKTAKANICMSTFIDRINVPFVIFQNFTVLSAEPLINVCSSTN